MRFKDFYLSEDKPIYNKSKEIWLDYLKKYKDDPKDLFVSFVSEDKVGINPKSRWDTPIGVYTYPLYWVLEENKIPFRGTTPPKKIKVLKLNSDKILSDDISEEDYNKTVEKIKEMYIDIWKFRDDFKDEPKESVEKGLNSVFKGWYKKVCQESFVQSRFGYIWNLTRNLSKSPTNWTKILIDIGFDVVIDDGHKVVHHNEPYQTVFLNPKSYKLIDEEFVSTEKRYEHTQKEYVPSVKILISALNSCDSFSEAEEYVKEYKKYFSEAIKQYFIFDDIIQYSFRFLLLKTFLKEYKEFLKDDPNYVKVNFGKFVTPRSMFNLFNGKKEYLKFIFDNFENEIKLLYKDDHERFKNYIDGLENMYSKKDLDFIYKNFKELLD